MGWTLIEDTPAPLMRWQCRLTAAAPESGPQSLALIASATVQCEGPFGAALVELRGSNSGLDFVPVEALRHGDMAPVPPVLWLTVAAVDADPTTDVLVTLVGRR